MVEVIFVEPSDSPVALPPPHDQAIILSAKPYKKGEARTNAKKLNKLMADEGFEKDSQRWWRFTWTKSANLAIHDFSVDAVPRR